MFAVRTISVSIARDWRDVYAFASRPENLPRWASGLGTALERVDGEWIAAGPAGPVTVRFAEPNSLGVLDHVVIPESGVEIAVPMRVVRNGDGAEVMFTLFRLPGVSDQEFASDAEWVERDLRALKDLLEGAAPRSA